MTARALLLAVDGLDWGLLQQLVDGGLAPSLSRLIDAGAQGRLALDSAGLHGAAAWTSVATGRWPDRHGVCHDLVPHADGLRLRSPGAADVQAPTLWQQVRQGGGQAWCLAWPSVLPPPWPDTPLADPGREDRPQRWAAGFEDAFGSTADCWPLAPGCVQPATLRDSLHLLRIHPQDLETADLAGVLPVGWHHPRGTLVVSARQLLARWATVQAAGVAWATEPGWQLLALRLDGLQHWCTTLRQVAPGLPPMQAEALACGVLDQMVGRYLQLLGAGTTLALVSDGSATATGGLVLAGPGVPRDTLLQSPQLVDVAPTLAGLLGLRPDAQADGRDLLARPAPLSPDVAPTGTRDADAVRADAGADAPEPDPQTLAWLAAQGVALPDLAPFRESARRARAAGLRVWASAREARGDVDGAAGALAQALQLDPQAWAVRVQLGRLWLLAGRGADCRALLDGLPEPLRMAPWDGLWAGLIAFGERHWALARQHLAALDEPPPGLPLNLPAWQGWACLLDDDAAAALAAFERAVAREDGLLWAWEGLGWARHRLAQPARAAQAFSRALALQPRAAVLYHWRAMAHEAAGDDAAAQADRWQALALDPRLHQARRDLVRSCLQQLEPRAAGPGPWHPA